MVRNNNFLYLIVICISILNIKALFGKTKTKIDVSFLPRLFPHSDKSYLVEFHSDGAEHRDDMEPVLRRIENECNTKIRRINIFRRREFMGILEKIGHDECGGLPFYWNRRTGQAVCGATSYSNLKRWAVGDLRAVFLDPPENLNKQDEEKFKNRKDIGAKGTFMEAFRGLERRNKNTGSNNNGNKSIEGDDETEDNEKKTKKIESKNSDGDNVSAASSRTATRRAKRKSKQIVKS